MVLLASRGSQHHRHLRRDSSANRSNRKIVANTVDNEAEPLPPGKFLRATVVLSYAGERRRLRSVALSGMQFCWQCESDDRSYRCSIFGRVEGVCPFLGCRLYMLPGFFWYAQASEV